MCMFKTPKAPPAPAAVVPPPMYIPESVDEQVVAAKKRERLRAANSYGRASTILAAASSPAVAPTGQSKSATGS